MSVTISSEEPAYLACTWQPVDASKGFTHSGCAYPSHATRLSCPSPVPTFVGRPLEDELLEPHAATTTVIAARTAASAQSIFASLIGSSPLLD